MGVLHRAVPATVALCLGVASRVEGSIVRDIVQRQRVLAGKGGLSVFTSGAVEMQGIEGMVRIRHPSGVVVVGAEVVRGEHGGVEVVSARIVSTGRRLMKGVVWW